MTDERIELAHVPIDARWIDWNKTGHISAIRSGPYGSRLSADQATAADAHPHPTPHQLRELAARQFERIKTQGRQPTPTKVKFLPQPVEAYRNPWIMPS